MSCHHEPSTLPAVRTPRPTRRHGRRLSAVGLAAVLGASTVTATGLEATVAPRTASAATLTKTQRTYYAYKLARSYVGRAPYVYGGASPQGFDCSGLARYSYGRYGLALPRTASGMRSATKRISRSSARTGDLVFFHSRSGRVYHVGIYAGGKNIMVDAGNPRVDIAYRRIWSSRVSFGTLR